MTRRVLPALALAVAVLLVAAGPRDAMLAAQPSGVDTLIAAGDVAPATDQHNANDYATAEEVLRLLADAPDATVLALGDVQYERGAAEAFSSPLGYDGSWGRFKARTCPASGNHDWMTPGASGFFAYFADRLTTCATSGRPDLGWYAFTLPSSGWRWYVLSSDCGRTGGSPDCRASSEQDRWLAADLQANAGRRCVGAAFHHPRWGNRAPFGDDPLMATFWNRLNHVHADLVLVGHEHAYARLGAMTPTGHLSPTGEGIRQLTVGTGGRSLIPFAAAPREGTRYRDAAHFGVLKLTLSPTSWTSQFVRTDGQTADSVSAGCWA